MKMIACLLLASVLPLMAHGAAENSQQNKMSLCNKAAEGKKGDERKAFMKTCLSAKVETTDNSQQNKMKICNNQADGKKGDERKAFMKTCLRGPAAATQ